MVEVTAGDPSTEENAHDQRIAVGPEGAVDSQAITQDSLNQTAFSDLSASDDVAAGGPVFQPSGLDEAAPDQAVAPPSGEASRMDAAAYAQSDRARRTRQIGLITALSTVGLITALVAFGFFVRWWQAASPAPTLAQQDNAPLGADPLEADPLAPDASPNPEASPVPNPDAAPEPDTAPEQAAEPEPADAPVPADTGDPSEEPATGPDAAIDMPPNELPTAASEPAASDDTAAAGDAPTAAEIAAEMMANPILLDEDTEEAETDEPEATEMPAAMRRWIGVLDFNNPGVQPDLPTPPTIDQVELDLPSSVQEGEFAAITDINVEHALARRMALDRRPAPLIRWLHLLSQISGLPIGVDMVALDAAGIDPLTSVTPPGGWTTAGEALAALAEQANCQLSRDDNKPIVLVDVAPQRIAAAIAPALRLDDLDDAASGHPDHAALLQLFTRLTQSPAVRLDDKAQLQVEGPPAAQWLAALTADALRIARGLPTRLPRQRTARWLVEGTDCEWPLVTAGPAIASIDRPLPTIDLLVRIGRANRAFPFIHWADALDHGLSPTTESMPWLQDATAGEALADMLDGHQLQTRIAGDGRWWIGTSATYDRSEVVALAKIDPAQADAIVQRLAASVGVPPQQLTAMPDSQSPYLILRGPRFIVRQLPKILSPQ